jgi:small subunit ribosomal protein S20
MPIKKSAKKALRQDAKRAWRNAQVKKRVKDLIKKTQKLIDIKNQGSAKEKMKASIKSIDNAVQKKILKKNAGARKKSRLMKKLNQIGK